MGRLLVAMKGIGVLLPRALDAGPQTRMRLALCAPDQQAPRLGRFEKDDANASDGSKNLMPPGGAVISPPGGIVR